MKLKLFIILLLSFYYLGCSSTKIVNVDINQKMNDEYRFIPVSNTVQKQENKMLKKYVRVSERRIRRIKKAYAKNKLKRAEKNIAYLLRQQQKIADLVRVDDYYSQVVLFKGKIYERNFDFDSAVEAYKSVPVSSKKYYNVAQSRIERITKDTDRNGFVDALEIQLKSSYNNPLSMP